MQDFKVSYDDSEDILYIAKEGEEEEIIELAPGVNVELDSSGSLIGVEVFNASILFKDVIINQPPEAGLRNHTRDRMPCRAIRC